MDDVRGDFLGPPHGTTPAAVIANEIACISRGLQGLRQDRVIIKPFLLGPVQTECATKALINTQMPRTMIMLEKVLSPQ